MVADLQLVAVAAFLLWGLTASLWGVLMNGPEAAGLVWHRRDTRGSATSTEGPPAVVQDVAHRNDTAGYRPGAGAG